MVWCAEYIDSTDRMYLYMPPPSASAALPCSQVIDPSFSLYSLVVIAVSLQSSHYCWRLHDTPQLLLSSILSLKVPLKYTSRSDETSWSISRDGRVVEIEIFTSTVKYHCSSSLINHEFLDSRFRECSECDIRLQTQLLITPWHLECRFKYAQLSILNS